jgi:uncharacterized OB-fold protein
MSDTSDTDRTDTDDGHPPRSPDAVTAESPYTMPGFFTALTEGRLLGARCLDCETRLVPPRPACYSCGSRDLDIEPQPKDGTVYSYTEVARPASQFADEAPFTVAVVELDTGARLTGRLETSYDETEIGMAVRWTVRAAETLPDSGLEHEQDWPLPVFESA